MNANRSMEMQAEMRSGKRRNMWVNLNGILIVESSNNTSYGS